MTQDKAHPTPPAVPTRISVSAERIDAIAEVMSEVLATVRFPVPYGELENKFARALAGLRAVQSLAAPVASTPPAVPSDREAFEAWYGARRGTGLLGKIATGRYEWDATQDAWLAFQAGRATPASLAAPVASNTTAEPAPIQPAGVEASQLKTGWPPSELMQDDHGGLSKALSNTPHARLNAREAAQALAGGAAK